LRDKHAMVSHDWYNRLVAIRKELSNAVLYLLFIWRDREVTNPDRLPLESYLCRGKKISEGPNSTE